MYQIINTDDINKARKEIETAFKEKKKIIVIAKDDNFNRKMFEDKRIEIIAGFECIGNFKNSLRQLDSGLNQVLCNLAKENGIKIGIDLKELKKTKDFELVERIKRIRQNIKLCRKYKANIIVINSGSAKKLDLFSFLLSLGMNTQTAKYALDNLINLPS